MPDASSIVYVLMEGQQAVTTTPLVVNAAGQTCLLVVQQDSSTAVAGQFEAMPVDWQ